VKRLFIGLITALVAIVLVAAPVLAGDPPPVSVELSDIEIEGGHDEGTVVTASGTITIAAKTDARLWIGLALAMSEAGYGVVDPDGQLVDSGENSESDVDIGLFPEADASQVFEWESTFKLRESGLYSISHLGLASTYWIGLFGLGADFAEGSLSTTWRVDPPMLTDPWQQGDGFQVMVATWNSHETYSWEGGYRDGHVLGEAIDQVGVNYPRPLRLVIPAGTIVNEGGVVASTFSVKYQCGGLVFHPTNITFSNPVTVYEFVDGEWVELVVFTKIVHGQPE